MLLALTVNLVGRDDIPLLIDDAAHYMKNGPSFRRRYLPFWIAAWQTGRLCC